MNTSILNLIHNEKYSQARSKIMKMNVVDIAQLLEELEGEKLIIIFRLLPKEIAVHVFSYMSNEQQQYIIETITDKEIRNIVETLFLDDTVDILEEMPANIVKKVLKNTSEGKRELINQFLNYPENSAGSIMTIDYVDFKKEMSIKKAIEHIRKTGIDRETINICYVINKNRKLEGIIPLRKLILYDENIVLGDIMETNIISISTYDDQEYIANLFKKYDLLAMPVVDNENRLVGIITIDDIVHVIEEENTEDFYKMAAMEPSEKKYLKTNVFTLAQKRIPWLLILMISATFTGSIIKRFEDALLSVMALAAYIPMLMDTGGNAGSQSATIIIRGLALDEIKIKDILKVLWKELHISIIIATVLSVFNFIKIYYFEKTNILISITVCISLSFTIILAKVVGGSLPIIAKRLKLDPAIMAGPLITTIVDALSLFVYFSIATYLLGI